MRFTPYLTAIMLGLISTAAMSNPVYLSTVDEPLDDARLRFILKFAGENAQEISQKTFDQSIQQHIKHIFGTQKSLSQDAFITRHQVKDQQKLSAFRDTQIKQTHVRFNSIDQNKDQAIDLHEFQSVGLKSFARYDSNKDGYMDADDSKTTVEEDAQQKDNASLKNRLKPLVAMPTTHNAQGFLALYTENNSKRVSLGDYLKMREQQYQRSDFNQDGKISAEEYEKEFLQRVDEMLQTTTQKQIAFLQQRFKAIDDNHDGKISPKDVVNFSKRYFAFWDTDGNGIVTQTEAVPK